MTSAAELGEAKAEVAAAESRARAVRVEIERSTVRALLDAEVLQVWGYSTLQAGLGMTPGPLIVMAVAPVTGRLGGRLGQRAPLVRGGVGFALGFLLGGLSTALISAATDTRPGADTAREAVVRAHRGQPGAA
jgi:uncharacterized membrane protein YeiH